MNTTPDAPAGRRAPLGAGRWQPARLAGPAVVGLVPAVALAALGVAGLLAAGPAGLADPGALTRWGLPALRALHDVAATMTIGLLALALLALPRTTADDRDLLGPLQRRAVGLAVGWAVGWGVLAVGVVLLTLSDVVGVGVLGREALASLGTFVLDVEVGRLLAGTVVLVVGVVVGGLLVRRVSSLVVLALVALGALMPQALGGHSAGADGHDLAVNTLIVHLAGVTVWVGGLAALVVLRARLGPDLAATVGRFSALAGWCFVAVAVSGVAGAVVRVGHWPHPGSAYGALVLAKVGALVALGVLGRRHRRAVLPALQGSAGRAAFVRLATGELVVMAVATGLGVALSRTPPV